MSREQANRDGFKPKAVIRDYLYVAQDPGSELLLGPAYAIPRLLDAAGISMPDVDVVELHEGFAGQVLAVQAALETVDYARDNTGREQAIGRIPEHTPNK